MSEAGLSEIVVVDTNVVSFFFKGDTRAALYKPHLEGRLQIIAAQTRAELELWSLLHGWGQRRRDALRGYVKDFILADADETICMLWARVQHDAQVRGRPVSISDAWIAATALAYNVPLVTHNRRDFENVSGLTVISES